MPSLPTTTPFPATVSVGIVLVECTSTVSFTLCSSLHLLAVVIPSGQASGVVQVTIVDDSVPEVAELFVMKLLSVELATEINGGRDFEFGGDVMLIDSQPYLGPDDQVDIVISQNDNANGIVSLSASTYNIEEGSTLLVQVVRSAGTFGIISVTVVLTPGSASGNGNDYIEPSSPLVMASAQDTGIVLIPITQDALPELQESFSVTLTQVEGGAVLGDITSASVFIAPSDDPNGRLRFSSDLLNGVIVTNPTTSTEMVELGILRVGGAIGSTEVGMDSITISIDAREILILFSPWCVCVCVHLFQLTWEVYGPQPGMEFMDIVDTQGTIVFANGQK